MSGTTIVIISAICLVFIAAAIFISYRLHNSPKSKIQNEIYISFEIFFSIHLLIFFIFYQLLIVVSYFPDGNLNLFEKVGLFFVSLIWGVATNIFFEAIHILPYLIARYRWHPKERAIYLLNVLAGWTIIGWIAAFVWAVIPRSAWRCTKEEKVPVREEQFSE